MIRVREIADPELRRRVTEALADRRGLSPAAVPAWYELDFVDLLNDLRDQEAGIDASVYEPQA